MESAEHPLERALRAAREHAAGLDPLDAARRCGASYDGSAEAGVFTLRFLGEDVRIAFPALDLAEGEPPLPAPVLTLIVYYLGGSDGTGPTGRWMSFADLPDGTFYVQAFRGYTGAVIARRFGDDPGALEAAVRRVGGEPIEGGADRVWRIPALPRIPLCLLWWDADDEFEARAEILFDETAPHHLDNHGWALLGSTLTRRLVGE